MNINNAYILEDRGILFVDGKDAKDFLQNLYDERNMHIQALIDDNIEIMRVQ